MKLDIDNQDSSPRFRHAIICQPAIEFLMRYSPFSATFVADKTFKMQLDTVFEHLSQARAKNVGANTLKLTI